MQAKPLGKYVYCGDVDLVKLIGDSVRSWPVTNAAMKLLVALRLVDC